MGYYAHISENCAPQTLLQHLQGTAALARQFSVEAFAEIAEVLGNIHDIGKYASAFQAKLQGKQNGYAHAAAGAIEIMAQANGPMQMLLACMMAYCIAGHHAGLQDGGSEHDMPETPSLYGVLNRKSKYCGDSDYSTFQQEIPIALPDATVLEKQLLEANRGDMNGMFEAFAFLTRYLFSCLKDADYLDTERYYMPEVKRSYADDFEGALYLVQQRLQSFSAETPLQKARSVLQSQAFSAAAQTNGISILHMPTGSGKTLCSLQIALQKICASHGRLKRIIYVIPYTSIIEQTAQEFEQLIGDHMTILQHHSNFAFDDDEGDERASDAMQKLKRSAENWDVPLVITTTVGIYLVKLSIQPTA